MAFSGIQGHKLEIAVVGCNQLKDTWYGRHKPYVSLVYGTTSYDTKISRDGGKNPTFNEKFEFSLTEGLHELIVNVLSSHHIMDSFIGFGKVKIDKTFREGYNTTLVPLMSLTGKQAGEVTLILHYYPNPNVQQQQQQQQGANASPYAQSPGSSPYPPPYSAEPFSAPQGSPIYPPQYGTQPSFVPQGSPYPPQYQAHPFSESPGSSSSHPQYQGAPAPQRPPGRAPPRYHDSVRQQVLNIEKDWQTDLQILRYSLASDRMNSII